MSWLAVLQTIGGLVLLLFGGELLLRGAVGLAQRFGISKMLIGFTVVAAATSMPEMVVVIITGLEHVPDVGVGNIIGSNIANILLILAAGAVLWPIQTGPREVLRDGLAVLAGSALLILFGLLGVIAWPHGLVMVALLVLYMAWCYRSERRRLGAAGEPESLGDEVDESSLPKTLTGAIALILVGIAGLVYGSDLLIEGAVSIARAFQISESVIGLTLVAVGTSLPELATAVVAGLRRHSEVTLGNVLGSNLFNILAVGAALTFTTPFQIPPQMMALDIWVMGGVSLLLIPIMLTGWRIGRVEAVLFLLLYAGYIAIQFEPLPL